MCKCFSAYTRYFVKLLIEVNVNIDNELISSGVYRRVNCTGSMVYQEGQKHRYGSTRIFEIRVDPYRCF